MIIPDQGKTILLDLATGKVSNAALGWLFGLWVNTGYTPSDTSVFADLTFATWSGYAPLVLTQSTWTSAVIDTGTGYSTWGSMASTFTVGTSPQTVQGWAIYTPSSPKIIALQACDTPIPTIAGMLLDVLPALRDKSIP